MIQWLDDEKQFDSILAEARRCVYIDSGRISTELTRLSFDDAGICTARFNELLQALMKSGDDEECFFIVLRPDPRLYFYGNFMRFPVLRIKRGTSSQTYLSMLNEGPTSSPNDSLGTNWWECLVVSSSRRWFVHALRSDQDNGGHLWVPGEWISQVLAIYPTTR